MNTTTKTNLVEQAYYVQRLDNNRVRYNGVDMGGLGTIIAENERTLVIKWPGGTHWSGRGSRSYHSPSIDVLQKGAKDRCSRLISWDIKRSAKT